jgi:hypothetical protein
MDDASIQNPIRPGIDPSEPHSARVWNYWIGGKEHYPADRAAGDAVIEVFPGIRDIARQSRALLRRVVRHLVLEAGIRQFLDIGTGLPTADNTHEVAQNLAPEARIVYVDNDPLVLAHARALLTSTPEGATAYIDANVEEPDTILGDAARTLDFDKPVALILLGILGNVEDYAEARSIVARLVDAIPPGSYLAINDGTHAVQPEILDEAARVRAEAGDPYYLRTPEEIRGFFDGLDLVDPGVVSTPRWRPEPNAFLDVPEEIDAFCGLGRK